MILAKQPSIDQFLDLDLEKPFVTPPLEGRAAPQGPVPQPKEASGC